ncbi:bifunctional diguanylate cyclase/phosphodiesterase [Marinomonas ostreistagni]|uniref:bifunctional diguanylate cyclase/phosphodiesterase n=1 Tax=Marinomonas ostreistagni TaxID=359209 RepID=UPI001950B521|nr:bifunctional diguanylate cyclase/phosphodiesterase [Marinomonas ostreistagni]MBM6549679.1 EAL domain-containing protein [Marinomonas ostreistagni]
MHDKIKALLEKHLPEQCASETYARLASEFDQLLQEKDDEIALLERTMDLTSDAMSERESFAVEHLELFETTFWGAREGLILVDFEAQRLTYNHALACLLNVPESFQGEISLEQFLSLLATHLENPDNFLSFLKQSHDNISEFEGELLLQNGRWLKYSVRPRLQHGKLVGRLWTLTDITDHKQSQRALLDYQQELQNAHELAKMGAWRFTFATQMFEFSDDIIQLLQLDSNQRSLSLESFLALVEDSQREELTRQFSRCQEHGTTIQSELQCVINGQDRYVILRGRLKVADLSAEDRIHGVLQDISDLRTSEHLVKVSSHFFQSSMQGNVLMDRQRSILDFNDVACSIFKLNEHVFAKRINERLATAWTHDMSINDIWRHVVEQNHWAGEVYFTAPEMVDKTLWLSLEALRDKQGKVINFIAIFNDITDSKVAEEQLHHMAYFDPQTALPNRFQFEQFLRQKLSSSTLAQQPITLFYLDLDRFKFVNDSLGHHAGDELLRQVGKRLTSAVPNATLVARQGGDEFVMLLTGQLSRAQQEQIASYLIEQLAEVFVVFETQVYIGASMGIVNLPADAQDLVSAMRYADISLYQAKKSGKGCYTFWQTSFLKDSTPERIRLESELREAILEDQLVLHFQPKVEANSGKVYGLEALVRWNHPRLGLVYPDQFIGIAEESNLILELDRWVVNAAAQQIRQWHQAKLPILSVSVNVSAAHVTRLELIDLFQQLLREYPYLINCLEIELTETAIMADPDKATKILNELRAAGVNSSVDDFGSGYTSLGYLKKLNANTLKIDRSFIDGITYDDYDRDVAKAIIALATSMSMEVVAEGVETKAQWDMLRSFGCKYLQGFFFSKPRSAHDIEQTILLPLSRPEKACDTSQ